MLAFAEKIMTRLVSWGGVCGSIAWVGIMIIVVMNVIARWLGHALPGTFDLVSTTMIVGSIYSVVYCQKREHHARADVVIMHLSDRVRTCFEAFTTLVSIGLWTVLTWSGVKILMSKWGQGEQTDILRISITPFRLAYNLALILMVILLVIRFFVKVKEGVSK